MSEYKPITGELRDTLERAECVFTNSAGFEQVNVTKAALDSMLDAIDAVHANLERENERLREQDRDGWVELPKDADGEYIHFGDVLDQFGTPMTVFAMSDPDPDQGDCMLELITDGISDSMWVRARKMRHYHDPTVVDVLREMADRIYADEDEPRDRDAIVSEYAKRLTLVGDSE